MLQGTCDRVFLQRPHLSRHCDKIWLFLDSTEYRTRLHLAAALLHFSNLNSPHDPQKVHSPAVPVYSLLLLRDTLPANTKLLVHRGSLLEIIFKVQGEKREK